MTAKVLITGGAGFIGSTIASAAIDAGFHPVILDNLVTGRREFIEGRTFYEGDISDHGIVDRILDEHAEIRTVIHCAALIVVPESVKRPSDYYRANVVKTLDLVDALLERGVNDVIFSSSASIYKPDADFSVDESSALAPTSPYARTKATVEQMLEDIARATPLRVLSLRYFNPIGADPKFRTGLQVASPTHALGKLIEARQTGKPFPITGMDFPTRDGTGIRDYVHVWDLAAAHISALMRTDEALAGDDYAVINLGTGVGTTVKELVRAFEAVTGERLEIQSAPPRPGDAVGAFSRGDRAATRLGWTATHSVSHGIADTLEWFARRGQILPDLG